MVLLSLDLLFVQKSRLASWVQGLLSVQHPTVALMWPRPIARTRAAAERVGQCPEVQEHSQIRPFPLVSTANLRSDIHQLKDTGVRGSSQLGSLGYWVEPPGGKTGGILGEGLGLETGQCAVYRTVSSAALRSNAFGNGNTGIDPFGVRNSQGDV